MAGLRYRAIEPITDSPADAFGEAPHSSAASRHAPIPPHGRALLVAGTPHTENPSGPLHILSEARGCPVQAVDAHRHRHRSNRLPAQHSRTFHRLPLPNTPNKTETSDPQLNKRRPPAWCPSFRPPRAGIHPADEGREVPPPPTQGSAASRPSRTAASSSESYARPSPRSASTLVCA